MISVLSERLTETVSRLLRKKLERTNAITRFNFTPPLCPKHKLARNISRKGKLLAERILIQYILRSENIIFSPVGIPCLKQISSDVM